MTCIFRPIVALVKYLIEEDEFNELREAILDGNVQDAVTIINTEKIDMNKRDRHGQTLLAITLYRMAGYRHQSTERHNRTILVTMLLQHGADPSLGSKLGKHEANFLYMILKCDVIDIQLLKMVLENKKDIVLNDHLKQYYFHDHIVRRNEREALFLLIKYGLPQSAAKNKCKETVSTYFKLFPYLVAMHKNKVPRDFPRVLVTFILGDL